MTDPRFKLRLCPSCGSSERTRIFDLPAQEFCAANWTYSKDYPRILDIAPEARFPVSRCLHCGFLYAELAPDAAFLALVYEEVIRHEDNLVANEVARGVAHRMRYIADLLELAHPRQPLQGLDYGCGLGVTLRLMESAGVKSVGFDASSIRTTYAASANATIVRSHGNLQKLAPYDLIVCDNILEHLPDPAETISFLASVSAAGAAMFVSVPDYNHRFIESQRRNINEGLKPDMSLNPWEHLNYFDIDHLDVMLKKAGFAPIPVPELVGTVDIGLRRDAGFVPRFKNACASGLRLAAYALLGRALRGPNRVFYRYAG